MTDNSMTEKTITLQGDEEENNSGRKHKQKSLDPAVQVKRSQGSMDPVIPPSENRTVILQNLEKSRKTEQIEVSASVTDGVKKAEKQSGFRNWQMILIPVVVLVIVAFAALNILKPKTATPFVEVESVVTDMKAEHPEMHPVSSDAQEVPQSELDSAEDTVIEIPDPVLKKAVQDAIDSKDEEITAKDALLLTSLEYDGTDKKEKVKDLTGLSEFRNLKYLNLRGNEISDLSALADLTKLTDLYLYNNKVSDLNPLSGLKSLTWLELFHNQVIDIEPLAGLDKLDWVDLDENQVSDLSPLSDLPALHSLSLASNQVSDLSPLSSITSLKSLSLSANQISDITPLASLVNLEYLYLYKNNISDIRALTRLVNLIKLSLGANRINDVTALYGLTNLSWLNLSDNEVSDVNDLSGLTKLETLKLSGNPVVDDNSREEIMSVFSGAENLTDTDF